MADLFHFFSRAIYELLIGYEIVEISIIPHRLRKKQKWKLRAIFPFKFVNTHYALHTMKQCQKSGRSDSIKKAFIPLATMLIEWELRPSINVMSFVYNFGFYWSSFALPTQWILFVIRSHLFKLIGISLDATFYAPLYECAWVLVCAMQCAENAIINALSTSLLSYPSDDASVEH